MNYPGSITALLTFALCFLALVLLVFPRPRLYVYTFLAGMLTLGLPAKALLHITLPVDFLEPVGDFARTGEQWDSALYAAACGALGVVAVRCAHLFYWRRRGFEHQDSAKISLPLWYPRWHRLVWTATLIVAVVVYWANFHFAFFQIGVNPKLILPYHGNVITAWLVNIGVALWIAALVWWHYAHDRTSLRKTLLLPMIEGYLSSISTISSIAYLIHAAPQFLTLWEARSALRQALDRRRILILVGSFLVIFALSIVTVFQLRILGYAISNPETTAVARLRYSMGYEVPKLFLQRWIGLEGMLTATAAPGRGSDLFMRAVKDDPRAGADSLFQVLAHLDPIREPDKFTFLTNAGPMAILWLSGSLMVVFGGMALCVLVLFVTEEVQRRAIGNPFLLAITAAGLVNVFVQTTFPYLSMIFVLQIWVALAFITGAERTRWGGVRSA